ncbi:MAG: hypothetical protein OER88_01475, partial [Planctomycetota bacterium]|nr:hypothetical protein [Planctomycetota bacterium]
MTKLHAWRAHWLWCLAFLLLGVFLALGWRARAATESGPASPHPMAAPEPAPQPKPAETKSGLLVDLGNTMCPVMDGDVDGETYFEWNGLRVGFCCPGCDDRFLSDPEGALDKTGAKWRDAL